MKPHDAILFFLGLALGWIAERALRRARTGGKRDRAIPRGTEGPKKPRKPRKPKADPAKEQPELPLEDTK